MLTNKKRILSIALALVLAFSAFGGMAFATPTPSTATLSEPTASNYLLGSAIPPSNARDCSTYVVTTTKEDPVTVSFIIEAGEEVFEEYDAFRVEIPSITLTDTTTGYYTVTDLLVALNKQISTYNLEFFNASGQDIAPSDNYLDAVAYNREKWEAGQLGFDGWAFRVNDKFPVTTDGTGYVGASILETTINSGDIVHFFYDLPADYSPASGNLAANYVRGIRFASTAASLTVQLQGHTTYIYPTSPYDFYVDNYVNLQGGVTARLYDSSGTQVGTQQTSDVNGRVTFSGTFTSGQTYYVKTDSVLHSGGNPSTADGVYFVLTGAYSKIVAP
jgi:hypothetical protein